MKSERCLTPSWAVGFQTAAGIAFGMFLAFTLAIGITQNVYIGADATPPRWVASIDVWKLGMVIGTAGMASAFLVTLYVADRNYRRSREHIPSLTLELEVVRTPTSLSYDAVMLALNAKNTGTGLCRVDHIIWRLKVVSPYDDETVAELRQEFNDAPDNKQDVEFPWYSVQESWVLEEIVIEPHQTVQMTCDFIIPAEVTAVVASAWVSNASELKEVEGWYRNTVHVREEALSHGR